MHRRSLRIFLRFDLGPCGVAPEGRDSDIASQSEVPVRLSLDGCLVGVAALRVVDGTAFPFSLRFVECHVLEDYCSDKHIVSLALVRIFDIEGAFVLGPDECSDVFAFGFGDIHLACPVFGKICSDDVIRLGLGVQCDG